MMRALHCQVTENNGGYITKYWITTARSIPLATKPFPRLSFAEVNHRIAPESTTTTADIRPMNIKKSHISAKCIDIMFAKSDSGLKMYRCNSTNTHTNVLC